MYYHYSTFLLTYYLTTLVSNMHLFITSTVPFHLDKRFTVYYSMSEEQTYIKSGETDGKWIENINNQFEKQILFFTYHNIFTRNS